MLTGVETAPRYDYWRPRGTGLVATAVHRVDRLFDRVYSSRYNPLYRTGTVAVLCLAIALVTGVYLLFLYEIGRAYDSVALIQRDMLLGRWIRALHRYASDVAIVAVGLHVLRLCVQGKTWGARTLAWVTGVLLAGMMFLSAVTGFVLVWDQFGQTLAVTGAKMLRLIPIFPEPPDRAFVGDRAVPSQFFFMNLFLHVAVPLGMIGFLWLHTARLARAAWFPERKVVWGMLAALVALAIVWPAPLPSAANLLTIPGRVETDWFYGFWIPLAHGSPVLGLVGAGVLALVLVGVPWTLGPRHRDVAPPAFADPDKCEGCEQCFKDCPYDAIQMVTGKYPDVHPLRAEVQPDLCVSCGLCAASCSSLAIGPPARTALHQLASARELATATEGRSRGTLLVGCRNNDAVVDRLRGHFAEDASVEFFDVDCVGTLHPGTVSYLASRFGATVVLGCPPQNCVHREGALLANARIVGGQKPAIPGRIDRQSVRVLNHSIGEWGEILTAIDGARRGDGRESERPRDGRLRHVVTAIFTAVLLAGLALGSRWPQGTDAEHAILRLGWRLAGQVQEHCRDLSAEELAKRPAHMRTPRECTSHVLTYDLVASVDGRVVVDKRVKSPGLRGDRPLSVEEDLPVAPGEHAVKVTFTPDDAGSGGKVLAFERTVRFEPARVVLVTSANDALVAR